MLELSFVNETEVNMNQFEKLADKAVEKGVELLGLHKDNLALTIQFVDEKKALELNKQYRSKDYIPDVLSFPVEMNSQEVQATGFREIGDIFICLEEAKRKTIKYKHTIEQEMGFLIVHGFLHLLGYDHETNAEDQKKMFSLQDQILHSINLEYDLTYLAEDTTNKEK